MTVIITWKFTWQKPWASILLKISFSFILGMQLNGLIGRRGHLQSLTQYWIVGRFIIISVLAQDDQRACLAAEQMFKLDPPAWYLRSILKDLDLLITKMTMLSQPSGKVSCQVI